MGKIIENLRDLNDNIITKRHEKRVSSLNETQKAKYDAFLKNRFAHDLNIIKRCRTYPEPGDVFKMNTFDELSLYGIVMNNHLFEDSLTVFVFVPEMSLDKIEKGSIGISDILMGPTQVFKNMWTKGLFFNISKCSFYDSISDYGYYDIFRKKFVDDYRNEISREPMLYDIAGISGIGGFGSLVYEALILNGYDVPWVDLLLNLKN